MLHLIDYLIDSEQSFPLYTLRRSIPKIQRETRRELWGTKLGGSNGAFSISMGNGRRFNFFTMIERKGFIILKTT
jgi:hypothetical protein